jgi:hypothetical protein
MKLTAEQFADLSASFSPGYTKQSRQERRRAARLELEAHLTIRSIDGPLFRRSVPVRVVDFSSRGIAILHETPLPVGSQFVVQMQRDSGGSILMLCTVLHQQPGEGSLYKMGAEFTRQLSEDPDKPGRSETLAE